MCIALPQQIFSLMNLISRIHGDQYRTNLSNSPECNIPLGYIGGPYGHMMARFNAKGNQAACKCIYIIAELRIRTCIIQCGILKSVLIRKFLHHRIQHLGKSLINQHIFLPDKISSTGTVGIQRLFSFRRRGKAIHINRKMGKNYLHFGKLCHPFGIPFQGKEPIIINRCKAVHHLSDRQFSFADQTIPAGMGIFYMYMADIGSQILYNRFSILSLFKIRMMHIPQGT